MTKPKRTSIPLTVRFEVFKRDSFTCQYCGAKAPDVVLQIDHIRPVADGGQNDILNLITSCKDCNGGKRDRLLYDNSAIEKQRKQLEDLNERREQLELLVKWREGLAKLGDETVEVVQSTIEKIGRFRANETGERDIRQWLRKYSLAEVLAGVDRSFGQYLKFQQDGSPDVETWNRAFSMVPRIIAIDKSGGMPPNKMVAFYVRGILRNRLTYLNERNVIDLVLKALNVGVTEDEVKEVAKGCSSWSDFQTWISDLTIDRSEDV